MGYERSALVLTSGGFVVRFPHPRPVSALVALVSVALAIAACGAATEPPVPVSRAKPAAAPPSAGTRAIGAIPTPGTADPGPATVDEARAFLARVDKDAKALWVARDTAG